ncbi:MAG: DUF1579 family protein [Gemmatimonadaceae bacterium]|nr:DUF1579 family protein [Gemmatimonadaceae bacterium]
MSVPGSLSRSVAEWTGHNKLWFKPSDPAFACATTARTTLEAGGNFLAMRYEWSHAGSAHHGMILLGEDVAAARCDAAWVDSFHNGQRLMLCTGPISTDGVLRATGAYPAPPGPDWGWRLELSAPAPEQLLLRMFNIMPDGTEALAVEASYSRRR